ncbi:MAG: lipopolysaccharide transport periplasmic protein LptA [Gammaproteobacteria bacterium RIFCSPLOWO2_02_FULL_56_15]|nr:MAG: lipopolysaccharide transport periplasmic protein LptA [Gammaproteobacteria bacterium RIFCSPLOWO2_02_FULL_56_15]
MYVLSSLKSSFQSTLSGLLLAANLQSVAALTSDQDQPIEIEASSWELDARKNVTVYTGNVVVKRGSIRMTGEKMTIYYTENEEIDSLIVEGNPATYRQLPDNSQVYDESRAMRIEFHEFENLVILIEKAEVIQERSRFSGDRIEYDTKLSQIKASSIPSNNTNEQPSENGRVKIIIKPRQKSPGTERASP